MSTATSPREPVPIASDRHRWLTGELRDWEHEGLISADTAGAIADRYVATSEPEGRGITPIRVVLGLGACFVGVGLIWLVAANLNQLSPLLRFVVVTAIWIGLAAAAELTRGLLSATLKLVTALAAGAVVFQAAQSLQVVAYRPTLLIAWGLGALLYAYARRSRAAGFVAITVLASWYVWQVMDASTSLITFTGSVLLASIVSVALGALHPESWRAFGRLWLTVGAVMSLIGVFAAAIPYSGDSDQWTGGLTAGVILAVGLAAAAAWRSTRDEQIEIALSFGALLLGILLSLWRPLSGWDGLEPDQLTFGMWVRTGLAILVFLVIAGGWAVVGARRALPVLSAVATIAIVIFTTFQAFTVFAPIISGATLFLTVGAVMIATGVIAERGRRRIRKEVEQS